MNKAFIALLWIATGLLTYWLGLEQGKDSAYSNAGIQSLPKDSSSMAKKEEEKSQQSPSSSSVLVPTETIVSIDTATFDPNSEEQRISELRTPDLQDRIKSSNPVSSKPRKFMKICRKAPSVLASFVCLPIVGDSQIRRLHSNGPKNWMVLIRG